MTDRDPLTMNGRRHVRASEHQEAPGRSSEVVNHPDNELSGRRPRPKVARGKRTTSKKDKELEHYLDGYVIKRESHTPFNTKGGFCDVFVGRHPIFLKVAMKRPRIMVHGSGDSVIKHFRMEAEIWSKLRHPNILHFIGMIEAGNHVWLISPFAANGSLPDYVKAHPETDREKLLVQLIHAIECLHRQNIVHGDIKGANILISENVDVLLCDFGLSKFQDMNTVTSLKGTGTLYWSAPELLLDDDPVKTTASDVYAFGMTVHQILSGNIPFSGYSLPALLRALSSNRRPQKEPVVSVSGTSYAALWEVAEASWATEPSERPKMEDIQARSRTSVDTEEASSSSEETSSDHDSDEFSESQDQTVRASNKVTTQTGHPSGGFVASEDPSIDVPSQPSPLAGPSATNLSPTPDLVHMSSLSLSDTQSHDLGDQTILTPDSTRREHPIPPIELVPQEPIPDWECKRQSAVKAVIDAQSDFVRDMEDLRKVSQSPQKSDIIAEDRRVYFVQQVFWNLDEIITVNTRLRDALMKGWNPEAIVDSIGDVFMECVEDFQPFVKYMGHLCFGKWEFEKEINSNPAFAQFTKDNERFPKSQKLGLDDYLAKPAGQLAQYPPLLEDVLRYTSRDNSEQVRIPRAIRFIHSFLARVEEESERRFTLLQIQQRLEKAKHYAGDLHLADEKREILFTGRLAVKTRNTSDFRQTFLFDHALLIVNTSDITGKLYQHIDLCTELEFLVVSAKNGFHLEIGGKGYRITFRRLTYPGKQRETLLWASTDEEGEKWIGMIQKQQEVIQKRSNVFQTVILNSDSHFGRYAKSAAPFNQGTKIAYGHSFGVYVDDLHDRGSQPPYALDLRLVAQVDVLECYGLLVVLTGLGAPWSLKTIPLDALDVNNPRAALARVNTVCQSSRRSFCKASVCPGRTIVCVVRTIELEGHEVCTVQVLEPANVDGNITLHVFKEIHISGTCDSVFSLEKKIGIVYEEGFDIIDLETLDAQKFPNPADRSTELVKTEHPRIQLYNEVPALAVYPIGDNFLLCYQRLAFYVNAHGWRVRPNLIIRWTCTAKSCTLHYPFIVVFSFHVIEIRHVETGQLVQVIQESCPECLYAGPPSLASSPFGHSDSTRSKLSQNGQLQGGEGTVALPLQAGSTPDMIIYKASINTIKALRLAHDSPVRQQSPAS